MFVFFFFNDTATTEIYTLSLHDALPIWSSGCQDVLERDDGVGAEQLLQLAHEQWPRQVQRPIAEGRRPLRHEDRKSTRLNSSHLVISYAVFCLKKKKYSTLNRPSPSTTY